MTATNNVTRVWLIDDIELVRLSIDNFLHNYPEIRLRSFSGCESAFAAVEYGEPHPHVILLDIQLDGMNGLDAIPKFSQLVPDARIVILTSYPNDSNIEKAISLGANGFLEKGKNTLEKIIPSIEDAMQGLMVLDKVASQKVCDIYTVRTCVRKEYQLTDREAEALGHFARGFNRDEVAERMYLSPSTIHTYEDNLHKKLCVNSRGALVAKAVREGLV